MRVHALPCKNTHELICACVPGDTGMVLLCFYGIESAVFTPIMCLNNAPIEIMHVWSVCVHGCGFPLSTERMIYVLAVEGVNTDKSAHTHTHTHACTLQYVTHIL